MRRTDYRAALIFAAALAGGTLLEGCVARVYPGHAWGPGEEPYYRRYVAEQHLEYREWHNLSPEEQHRYWDWRDHHHD
jgi:hypothetical protein